MWYHRYPTPALLHIAQHSAPCGTDKSSIRVGALLLSVLTEPLIRIANIHERRATTLPGVYAALMSDTIDSFPALRPHQRHAWHAFLVQLGAKAMHASDTKCPPTSAEEWGELLRVLSSDHPDDCPWRLVVDDITRPAFLQPPRHLSGAGRRLQEPG